MPSPADVSKRKYMFTDDIKFFQKVAIFHPTDQTRFLAIKRASFHPIRPNLWDFPGGNIAFGEKHIPAGLREIKEETGLEVEKLKPVAMETNFEKDIYYIFVGHRAKALSDSVTLSEEHTEYKWVTVDEFLHLESAQYLQDMVKNL